MGLELGFEGGPWNSALADDGQQGADRYYRVVRNRDGHGRSAFANLHDDVAAAPAYLCEPIAFEDPADLSPRQDAQSTHARLRSG